MSKKKPKINNKQFKQMILLYTKGESTVINLAKKFKVNKSTIYYYIKKYNKSLEENKKRLLKLKREKEQQQIPKVKMYKDYLKEENLKRKKNGHELYEVEYRN